MDITLKKKGISTEDSSINGSDKTKVKPILDIEIFHKKEIQKLVVDDYIFLEKIGKGSSATVYKVFCKKEENFKALKCFKINDSLKETYEDAFNEMKKISELQELNNENIVKFYGIFSFEDKPALLLEYGRMSLFHLLDKYKKIYTEKQVIGVLRDLSHALNKAEEKYITHRDIKPGNIILSTNNRNFILTDFGLGAEVDPLRKLLKKESCVGTKNFMAPELSSIDLDAKEYNPFKADVFSLGVTCLKMLDPEIYSQFNNCKSKNLNLLNKFSPEFEQILLKMLNKNPEQRPSFKEIEAVLSVMGSEIIDESSLKGTEILEHQENYLSIAEKYKNLGLYEASIDCLEKERLKGDDLHELRMNFKIVNIYLFKLGEFEKARELIEKCYSSIKTAPPAKGENLELLLFELEYLKAHHLIRTKQKHEAKKIFKSLIETLKQFDMSSSSFKQKEAFIYLNLALIESNNLDNDDSYSEYDYIEEAEIASRSIEKSGIHQNLLMLLGKFYLKTGNFKIYMNKYEQVLRKYIGPKWHPEYLLISIKYSNSLIYNERYREAERLLEESYNHLNEQEKKFFKQDRKKKLLILKNLIICKLESFKKNTMTKCKQNIHESTTLPSIPDQKSNLAELEYYYKDCFEILESDFGKLKQKTRKNAIADCLKASNYLKSFDYALKKVKSIHDKMNDKSNDEKAKLKIILGEIYYKIKNKTEALKLFLEAEALGGRLEKKHFDIIVICYFEIDKFKASEYAAKGKKREKEKRMKKETKLNVRNEEKKKQIKKRNMGAVKLFEKGKYDAALKVMIEAVKLNKKLDEDYVDLELLKNIKLKTQEQGKLNLRND